MYYLQSRYYDPEIGRFINADVFVSTGRGILGNNMFAYCGNNPVNYIDKTGYTQNPYPYGSPEWFGWELGRLIAGIPSKEKHYSRNDEQADITNNPEEIINSSEWVEQPNSVNIYHMHENGEQGADAKYNVKYMTSDKHKEVVINFSDPDNPYIVTDPYNLGTYNYGTDILDHAFWDVLPYWLYGNSVEDSGFEHAWARLFGA